MAGPCPDMSAGVNHDGAPPVKTGGIVTVAIWRLSSAEHDGTRAEYDVTQSAILS